MNGNNKILNNTNVARLENCIPLKEAKEISLKVSGAYEGENPSYSTLTGNFDKMGMSWGLIQWNFGQGTLAPLLKTMQQANLYEFNNCFSNKEDLDSLNKALNGSIDEQKKWAINMQQNYNTRWKSIFNNLANVKKFQEIQLEAIEEYDNYAINIIKWMRKQKPKLMKKIELVTFVALHDLAVQQQTINKAIPQITNQLRYKNPTSQKEFLKIVVYERGATANEIWRADAISRRMGIINKKEITITHSGKTTTRTNINFNLIKEGFICEL
ncbi:hypothetical protein AAX26_02040 [Aliarcobacter thereius]|uniref:hypothetical protein n=1 Tax=Aliarcobacter thereius TaxID=544718 RepID=UPI000828B9DC|nr:hypothetical protein [Aliarcobacter thereius]OCL85331.1 hypothetical protein AAX26_02040 [Aliarcobacter thereius]